jgi:hypothetical protein
MFRLASVAERILALNQQEEVPCFGMHSSLSPQSCLLPQAWFPMMRLPAAVEVAAFAAAVDFMAAACARVTSGAAPFTLDVSADTGADTGLPDAAMAIVE